MKYKNIIKLQLPKIQLLTSSMQTTVFKMAVFWVVAPCKSSTRLHGATTQKTAIFILTAVKTSNPTYCIQIFHQRLISAAIRTALLNNVRKAGRLVLSRTS
jgi:hypothetical protein